MASFLDRFRKSAKTETAHSTSALSATEDGLILHVGTSGFVITEMAASGELVAEGMVPSDQDSTVDRIENVLQNAISQCPAKRLKQANKIAVILDSDDTQFVDMRQSSLGSASSERIRDFGLRLTGARFVSFGKMSFGAPQRSKGVQHGLLGFIDHGALERYLAALGEHCTKLSHIVPAASLLVSRAEGFEKQTYASILIGGKHTTIVVANFQQHTALVRYVPVGLESLVSAVANQASISAEQVLNNFSQRDYFRALIEKESEGGSDISIGPIEDAMMPHLRKLSGEILNTLEYFEQQLGAEMPTAVELLGDSDQLKGFRDWLNAALNLEVQRVDTPLSDGFRHGASTRHLNLLTGLEGNPILVGKARYTLHENKLIKSAPPKRKPAKQKQQAARSGGRRAGRRAQEMGSGSGESFFAKLFAKKEGAAPAESDELENENAYFFIFFALIFAVFYLGYQSYAKVDKLHDRVAVAYSQELSKSGNLKKDLTDLGVTPVQVTTDLDKVLWTEKFLALATHMTGDLWLTDVYVEDASTTFGNLQVTTKRLSIEGAALPSSEGHIAEIADFIKRLESDNTRFMNDFRLLTFEGSSVDENDRDPVVRFLLSAWYDKTKRIELKKDEEEGEGGALGSMQRNVSQRNEFLENARTGGLTR